MFSRILYTISILFKIIDGFYLEAESNYLKPKLERNNIVNKGIWIRNKMQEDMFEKMHLELSRFSDEFKRHFHPIERLVKKKRKTYLKGNFIFRPNSVDADNVMNNNFDAFNDNVMQGTPAVSSYVQRDRRSPDHIRKRRPRKSMKSTKTIKNSIEDSVMIKSKIMSDLKPTSVFNEYPYEVAILLDNESKSSKNITHKSRNEKETIVPKTEVRKDDIKEELNVVLMKPNVTVAYIPTRSKKYDHDTEVENNIDNMVEEYNKTEVNNDMMKPSRDTYDGDEKIWKHNVPLPDTNIYKVIPKEPEKSKTVTERGLIKIISMLTKTFKKITKKHGEIKNIHDKLVDANQDFDRRVTSLLAKFEDFDSKYSDMIQFNNKIKEFEAEMGSQRKLCEIKHQGIHNTFSEFQTQQTKFLEQQKQFYGIQRLMLAQNEKINAKQNQIAKTQSEISHRQNNFARILKKAKQIIDESKIRVNYTNYKQNDNHKAKVDNNVITSVAPLNTQGLKINLFSIPAKNKLQNQDALIIRDKDDKQIDELVYKYYFNNTFIDNLMKSKILNNYASNMNSVEIVSRSNQGKIKRDEIETTKLYPISNIKVSPVKRERRWINHFSKNKYRRLNRHRKETTMILNSKERNRTHTEAKNGWKLNKEDQTSDPFVTMATNFCNEIGQNTNEQSLKWCVEKSLRRLKFMETNAFTPPPDVTVMTEQKPQALLEVTKPTAETSHHNTEDVASFSEVPQTMLVTNAVQPPSTLVPLVTPLFAVPTQGTAQTVFFPDNDELESNLKQYDLKPDTEGNVYYDGSLHISDFGRMLTADSDGTYDIMPGLMDSNSKVDLDPRAFDLQAKRRAYVRRINEGILKQMKG